MKLTEETEIEYTVSGRMDVLIDTWKHVREKYVSELWGEPGVQDAIAHLEDSGKWSGRHGTRTLYLSVTKPS